MEGYKNKTHLDDVYILKEFSFELLIQRYYCNIKK